MDEKSLTKTQIKCFNTVLRSMLSRKNLSAVSNALDTFSLEWLFLFFQFFLSLGS